AQKSPKLWLAALVASSVAAISYKIYNSYTQASEEEPRGSYKLSKQSVNKSIVLTLSSSVINSKLPLNDILVNSQNVVFILPPNLSEEDLNNELNTEFVNRDNNYKLLKCLNLQGYVQMLKNLQPDLLLICADDLGLSTMKLTQDLSRFIKQIVNIDQTNDDICAK
ncbi:uncharacterized protein CANTADRAFT_31419, partial [Suhomyces tanzawaensis NRRL Y-17324]